MTRYSIPAETPPQNLFTLTTDDDLQVQSAESFDWESRMARLVGFEEESSSPDTEELEEFGTPTESLSQPQEVQTKQSLSSNPFAKLGLVGAATLAIVLVGGLFLSQLMSSNSQKPKIVVSKEVQKQPTNESVSQQLEGEVDTLKTKLALTEQADLVKAAQQKLRTAKSTVVVPPQPLVSSRERTIPTVIPTPAPIAYVPRTVTIERIVKVPASQPLPTPQLPVVKPDTQPVIPVVTETPPSPPTPLEEWARLAKLGSYGQVNVTDQSNSAASYAPPSDSQVPKQTPKPNQTSQRQTPPPVVSQPQQQGAQCVAVGASAKAVLATAIFGETTKSTNPNANGNDTGEGKNVFVIRLKEPLKCKDGSTALAANTEFLTEVRSISEQGFLQMNVVKVILQNNGNPTEQTLPNNAVIIRGTQGKPLIANKFPSQGSSIASMDAGLFVLGGISKAAELINRSDTELQPITTQTTDTNGNVTGNTTTLTTVTQNRRNLGAGVVEGGLNSVVPQIAQRNQQAIAQMSQQTNVWFLPAGKDIEIYLNQAIQF